MKKYTEDIAKEVITIVDALEKEVQERIPEQFRKVLRELANESNLKVILKLESSIENQEISEECKDILAMIYYSYFADETTKKELVEKWKRNDVIK